MPADLVKGILGGIVTAACRGLEIDQKNYRIRPGGRMIGGSQPEWYTTVQNPRSAQDVSRNTKKAKELCLVKTSFAIVQTDTDKRPRLIAREWDATIDWNSDYRTIFEADADDMGARRQMAELMRAKIIAALA